jgi:RimJ/RimL family protein N-acetyltransferase
MARESPAPRTAPTLTDGVVTLRAHRRDDLAAVVLHARDPEMVRWTRVPSPYVTRDAEDFLATMAAGWLRGSGYGFAVEVDGGYAGALDLRPQGDDGAEVGYALAPWARGRGVMSRALRLALTWGFDVLGLEVVHWQAQVGNWASRRVAWAVGFRVEGTVRRLLAHRERRVDAWVGSLCRGDDMQPVHAWLDPPVLVGDRVVLRPHHDTDVPRIVTSCRDEETRRWLSGMPEPYTEHNGREHLARLQSEQASGRAVYWTVAEPETGRMLGEIGIFVRDELGRHGEIGYWTHPDARGQGAATAAARLAARHALLPREDGGLGMDRLLLRAAAGNIASRRVAEKAGFRQVGVDRAANRLSDGSIDDDIRFDLLPAELPPPPEPAAVFSHGARPTANGAATSSPGAGRRGGGGRDGSGGRR